MDPATIAAIVTSLGSLGSAAISKKTDSPDDPASVLDWTYTGGGHSDRPGYNEGGKAYRYMSSHFQKPPDSISEDQKVFDDSGRLLGWFMEDGPAKSGFGARGFKTKNNARQWAKTHPYEMNRGTEGEMWLGQRENIFRQDLDFSNREFSQNLGFARRQAANQLSIRQENLPGELAMRRRSDYFDAATSRGVAQFDQDTRHQNLEREWDWQQQTAADEGAAFRARMQAQYPGASTWDLLSGGSASSAGPGAVPGIPGMQTPSMGTHRSGPDPSVTMAKLQADNAAMQTIAQTKIAGAQMRLQDSIAKRNALISFMNTAIEGAKTPVEIMSRAAAAKKATEEADTESNRRASLDSQWQVNTARANQISRMVKPDVAYRNAQTAKSKIDAQNAAYGSQVEQFRRLSDRGDVTGLMEMLGLSSPAILRYFRRSGVRKHKSFSRSSRSSRRMSEQHLKQLLDEAVSRP